MNGNTIEEKLREVTGIVFNNWFALKIALDHGQGGPPAVQNGKIETLLSNVTAMVMSQNGDISAICDYLDDYMDDEFNTVLEDDSHLEVVEDVNNLYNLLKSGSEGDVISKLGSFPIKTTILSYAGNKVLVEGQSETDDDSTSEDDVDMEQDDPDPGWTVVKNRRK